MAFTFGRLTLPLEPLEWHSSGTAVTMNGGFTLAVAAAEILRDQLLGFAANPDEPVVPITSTVDPAINGYYRVLTVDIMTGRNEVISGHFDYSITLERIRGFNSAGLESVMTGALAANDLAVVEPTPQPWHVVPSSAHQYSFPISSGFPLFFTRTSDEGAMQFTYLSGNVYKGIARYTLPLTDHYVGSARIEDQVGTGSVHTMVGIDRAPSLTTWRLSNGLTRVSLFSTSGVSLQWYNGTSWGPTHSFIFSETSGSHDFIAQDIRILRNGPEEGIVRILGVLVANGVPVTLDLALRRGARVLRGYITVEARWSEFWRIRRSAADAATALTGGIMATAADANGGKWVLMSARNITTDLVNGRIDKVLLLSWMDFGIGQQIAASSSAAGQDLIYQYLAAQAEAQIVVAH